MTQTAEVQARPIAHATAQATERATGLTLLALAAAVIGIALLLWAGTWFALYGANDIVAGSRLAAVGRVMGLIMVVVGVLAFVLAHGLWELRSWAWPARRGRGHRGAGPDGAECGPWLADGPQSLAGA